MPFKLDDPHVLNIYRQVHELLSVFLVCQPEIARAAFQTMFKTDEQRRSSSVIEIPFSALGEQSRPLVKIALDSDLHCNSY